MAFFTQIPLQKEAKNPISYNSKIVLLGSCFSENIGTRFSYYKFQSVQNPFGILFHPKAIERFITNAINKKEYTEDDLFYLNERWHSFDAHSFLSTPSKKDVLTNLNSAVQTSFTWLGKATHLIITPGTSWVYRHIESDTIVANCHKVPQKKFLKELMSVEEIVECLEASVTLIKSINRKAAIIFTISPVRHLKDGFIENQQSKSHLIAAIQQVVDGGRTASYFPSYELMMDELPDYRFYAEDMIHPNKIAIDYLWKRFSETWISGSCHTVMEQVAKIQQGLNHKAFNPNSKAHQQFLSTLRTQIIALQNEYPFMSF